MFTVSFRNHNEFEIGRALLQYLPRIGEKITMQSTLFTVYDIIYMLEAGTSSSAAVLVYVH